MPTSPKPPKLRGPSGTKKTMPFNPNDPAPKKKLMPLDKSKPAKKVK